MIDQSLVPIGLGVVTPWRRVAKKKVSSLMCPADLPAPRAVAIGVDLMPRVAAVLGWSTLHPEQRPRRDASSYASRDAPNVVAGATRRRARPCCA